MTSLVIPAGACPSSGSAHTRSYRAPAWLRDDVSSADRTARSGQQEEGPTPAPRRVDMSRWNRLLPASGGLIARGSRGGAMAGKKSSGSASGGKSKLVFNPRTNRMVGRPKPKGGK